MRSPVSGGLDVGHSVGTPDMRSPVSGGLDASHSVETRDVPFQDVSWFIRGNYKLGIHGEQVDLAFRRLLAARPASNEAIATIVAPEFADFIRGNYKLGIYAEQVDLAFRRLLAARPASNEAIAKIVAPEFASFIRDNQLYPNKQRAIELAGKLARCGPVARNVEETLFVAAQKASNEEIRNAIYGAIRGIRRASITGSLISTDDYPIIVVRSEGQDWRLRMTEDTSVGRDSLQNGAVVTVQFDIADKRILKIEKPHSMR
jgi:hypothetical protein